MNADRNLPGEEATPPGYGGPASADGWVRLPEPGGPEPGWPERGTAAAENMRVRSDGVRRVRRMSNWTAAALIVGTGAAAVALAHHSLPGLAPAASTASTTGIGGTTAANGVANGAAGPQVSHSVATTSGSGVVVTTQTKTVNGRVVVTQVRHTVPYHDN